MSQGLVEEQVRMGGRFEMRFPNADQHVSQDEEWFEVRLKGEWRRFRVHDYADLYSVPGLYEALVYDRLKCRSPKRVVSLLMSVLEDWPLGPSSLRVLDLGAGNGVVGMRLREAGVKIVIGADLLEEAAEAARRDRPSVYDAYLVGDVTKLSESDRGLLAQADLNCLATVAALGFSDIPPEAFAAAYNAIASPGWVAFTIKENFLSDEDSTGFSRLIRTLVAKDALKVEAHRRYCHRLSIDGKKLFYLAVVARKLRDIQSEDLASAAGNGAPIGSAPVVDTLIGAQSG